MDNVDWNSVMIAAVEIAANEFTDEYILGSPLLDQRMMNQQ